MQKICYVPSRLCKEIIHVHQYCGKHHILASSEMAPYFFIFANRNKTEPREVTKQVVKIILRNRIFHGTIRHIRIGFPSYARTLCALTLLEYALNNHLLYPQHYIQNLVENGPVVSEKRKFQCLYVNNIRPRSRNDLDLQYSLTFIN